MGGGSLKIQYDLSITPSYRHTWKTRLSRIVQETEKQLEKPTRDIKNEEFNVTLDHHNSSLRLLSGETDKYEFIESLTRLINKFGLKTFFYLLDNGNTKILYLIIESHPHTMPSFQHEQDSRCNLPYLLLD